MLNIGLSGLICLFLMLLDDSSKTRLRFLRVSRGSVVLCKWHNTMPWPQKSVPQRSFAASLLQSGGGGIATLGLSGKEMNKDS